MIRKILIMALITSSLVQTSKYLAAEKIVFKTSSEYEKIFVVDKGIYRYLRFGSPDSDEQSCINLIDPDDVPVSYVRFSSIGMIFLTNPKTMLMMGLGGGNITTLYQKYYPELYIDAVEIDPEVADIAVKYFNVVESEDFKIHVEDGRKFIEQTKRNYDIIVLDAYDSIHIPFHLITREFFLFVKHKLNRDGIVISNVINHNKPLFNTILKTYISVFPEVYLFPSNVDYNTIIVAVNKSRNYSRFEIMKKTKYFARKHFFPYSLVEIAKQIKFPEDFPFSKSEVFTDREPELLIRLQEEGKKDE